MCRYHDLTIGETNAETMNCGVVLGGRCVGAEIVATTSRVNDCIGLWIYGHKRGIVDCIIYFKGAAIIIVVGVRWISVVGGHGGSTALHVGFGGTMDMAGCGSGTAGAGVIAVESVGMAIMIAMGSPSNRCAIRWRGRSIGRRG